MYHDLKIGQRDMINEKLATNSQGDIGKMVRRSCLLSIKALKWNSTDFARESLRGDQAVDTRTEGM